MKYIKTFEKYTEEKTSIIRFVKKPKNKDAKTDTYSILKDGNEIGVIKWDSRIRSYSYKPTAEHQEEINLFIKDLMAERRKK